MNSENKNCWLYDKCNHIDCDGFCIKRYKLDYLYNQSLLPEIKRKPILLYLDKDNSDKEAFSFLKEVETNILDYVQNASNFYIHSTICGNGKSSWAIKILQSYLNKIWAKSELKCRVLFINVPQFLISLKDNISNKNEYAEHIKENIYDADIVVWDDIGNKVSTQFEADNLLAIIDARMNRGKSNIYTSNLSDEEMHQFLGDRLTSRIVNSSYDIELRGADKRGLVK